MKRPLDTQSQRNSQIEIWKTYSRSKEKSSSDGEKLEIERREYVEVVIHDKINFSRQGGGQAQANGPSIGFHVYCFAFIAITFIV